MADKLRRVEFQVAKEFTQEGYFWDRKTEYETKVGYFHCWGEGKTSITNMTDTNASCTIGIVEDEDGKVWNLKPTQITFSNRPAPELVEAAN